ncbi:hypothetical protein EV200_101404 [Pedobacter psychrotolerans]|uniref:Transglutaminase superfamily protein n=1 Tax=Pedobacter psychrotolerans TaxID=1843235 RepID=A0A4R2HM28_9SPHI|nr:hypothetical protein [Pedobacter psychrotolerans]TCO30963.1 hypothetical protein EV200_101404 [Pedobacter psychrotolerans]GGE43242.1 hypothetical protein GCM10011413_06480 [Pedobacter psychrotolerans]
MIHNNVNAQQHSFDFYDGTFNFTADSSLSIAVSTTASLGEVKAFYNKISTGHYDELISNLKAYQNKQHLNDWIYYQLIRKVAEQISPKSENYFRYTLYKWFLLNKCGYDARLAVGNDQVIFYVKNDEDISDIPFFMIDHKKYMCLNYHDYGKLFKEADAYKPINIVIPEAKNQFSYKVTRMPDFKPEGYEDKNIEFSYKQKNYHFKLKINNEVQSIFKNYPVVDFESYFNIPLSRETYSSLIPTLKANLKKMDQKKGIDYLMRFTRYAFLYEDDGENFGKEKRNAPEQTLLSQYSDCDDRAALFFYLVKEIYNLPMVAVLYPEHLTIAVNLDKPVGNPLTYNGRQYSFCEPTPQFENLKIGQISSSLKHSKYEIVYAYEPKKAIR